MAPIFHSIQALRGIADAHHIGEGHLLHAVHLFKWLISFGSILTDTLRSSVLPALLTQKINYHIFA